jgi:hypothetical protein
LSYEWKLITKQTIPGSKGKRHHNEPRDRSDHQDTQEFVIEEYAKALNIPRDSLHRPEPYQMLYATALHLIATERLNGKGKGERILKDEYHWSDVVSSDGSLVNVGTADRGGAFVNGAARHYRDGDFGVCVSRDPSFESLDT